MPDAALVIITIITILLSINTLWINIITIIDKVGIHIQLRLCPFYTKCKSYSWDDISKAYIRRYLPIWEFGGWGIRFGFNSITYNMSGNIGLQLVMQNNKKILIGTKKKDKLSETLRKLGKSEDSKE